MIQKKICMIGAFAVGKTSLVSRAVLGSFSDKYLTTVGVKIDKLSLTLNGTDLNLIVWDLHGEDEFQTIRHSYLRGASGYFLVIDGTRQSTLDTAISLRERCAQSVGNVPFIAVLNKSDLRDQWEISSDQLDELRESGWEFIESSAKSSQGVDRAFESLASQIVGKEH